MTETFPYHTLHLETARLLLRPMAEEDLALALSYYDDMDFRRGMEEDWQRTIDLAELRDVAGQMARQGYLFTVVERATGRAVGEVCLQWMSMARAEVRPGEKVMRMPIGIWDKRLWGQGYGREIVSCLIRYAFDELRIDRLCAMGINVENQRSQRLWLACGMRVARRVTEGSTQEMDLEITRDEYQRSCQSAAKRLVAFDVDGTLVHSLKAEGICFPRACEMVLGLDHVSDDWSSYAHPSDSGIVAELVQRHFNRTATAEDFAQVEHRFLALLKDAYHQQPDLCRAVSGAIAAFQHVRQLPDTSVALATAGWSTTALFKLSVAGFDVTGIPMASSHDAMAKADIMKVSVERAQVHAKVPGFVSVICVGDADGDARAAAACGFEFIGIDTSGFVPAVRHRFPDFGDLAAFSEAIQRLQRTPGRRSNA